MSQRIALSGATGFVGGYVLRGLLAAGHHVVALARAGTGSSAADRVAATLKGLDGGATSPTAAELTVLPVDLGRRNLGLDRAAANRLRQCSTLIHAAACVDFDATDDGEPARTNVEGTRRLWEATRGGELRHWIQVSTAYAAGMRQGPIAEDDHHLRTFRNAYEASKWQGEEYLRSAAAEDGLRLSILRPGTVLGEHHSGRTSSYRGTYVPLRALGALARQAELNSDGRRQLNLRLNIDARTGRNLVPVDWTARVITAAVEPHRRCHGAYHLTPATPTTTAEIVASVHEHWNCTGLTFSSVLPDDNRSAAERWFYKSLLDLAPYWRGEPRFDRRRFAAEFGDCPCPRTDVPALVRLWQFADRDHWGRKPRDRRKPQVQSMAGFPCGEYLERFLPQFARRSSIAQATRVSASVNFQLSGPGGGVWTCVIDQGDVRRVTRGAVANSDVVYSASSETFGRVVTGRLKPQQAFLQRQVEIDGNIEAGLKLAILFGQFIEEFPFSLENAESKRVA